MEFDRNALWARVDALVDQAPNPAALRRHRLHLLAADLHERRGLPVSAELREARRAAAMASLAVPFVLRRMRAVVEGPLVLMKGPEIAASYPRPQCRPFRDLDVLTADAERSQAALLDAGFVEVEGLGDAGYHLPALAWPGMPLLIEVHRTPHYVRGLPVPLLEVLLELTGPSRTGIEGVQGLLPHAHAVLIAVHGWATAPLERIGHLVDVAAVLADTDPSDADAVAASWGCERLWRTTTECIDALFGERPGPIALGTWARHLRSVREPSVLEAYVARTVAPLWALPGSRALVGVGAQLARTALPYEEESWADQLTRSRRALVRAGRPLSEFRA